MADVDKKRPPLAEKWDYIKKAGLGSGWASREEFIEWSLAHGFAPEKSLLRKNKRLPHGPDNCYWRLSNPGYRESDAEYEEKVLLWNKTVNRFRRALGLPLFPEE